MRLISFSRDMGAVNALHPRRARRHKQHVAHAQRLLGAQVKDGARIDLRGYLEGNAAGEIGLDEAGDDVDRGPLRGDQQMHARGAGHLRQPGDRALRRRAPPPS